MNIYFMISDLIYDPVRFIMDLKKIKNINPFQLRRIMSTFREFI